MATSYQDDYMKTALRLPRELHAQLMEAARERGRSFNSEVIDRLQASFGAFQMSAQMGPAEPQSAGESFVTAGQAEEIARRAGEVAAREVLRFQAESLQPVHFGGGSVVQGPPPAVEPKVRKHGPRVTITDRTTKKKSAE